MEALLENYPVQDILMFIVMLAFAIKGVVSFFDWASERIKKVFKKEQIKEDKEELIEKKLKKDDEIMLQLSDNQKELSESLNQLAKKVDLLIDSDKDDIKSFLTKEHHYFCYKEGWIDDYSLDCCEKRFAHYEEEGGNSFIKGFMSDLRKLPKKPIDKKIP